MTVDEVRERVEKIRTMRGDSEAAHANEDELYLNLLEAIADGTCLDPKHCAEIAVTTRGIKFSRWYA